MPFRTKWLYCAAVAIGVLGFAIQVNAQVNTATLIGQVTDAQKGVLPGVSVTVTEQRSGRELSAFTDERGEYRIVNIPPGTYRVEAALTGFATARVADVELRIGQNATIPLVMNLAGLEENLTVTGESPLVDTVSNQVAGNIDPRQMEALPIQGRNWLELSILVKGITANNVSSSNPGVRSDDMYQLNLDGQQVTQRVSVASAFGQPKFSREAIAEFQLVTNMFDVTQGRSAGIQVQAITRSGTNRMSGSTYGFFKSDVLNARDPIALRVLPESNQQVGGAFGGPIVRNKVHFFGAAEYERAPYSIISRPTRLPSQQFSFESKAVDKSYLGRVDYTLSSTDFVSVRGTFWNWSDPFAQVGSTTHPSQAAIRTRDSLNVIGTWSKVLGGNKLSEFRLSYNGYSWLNDNLPEFANTPVYVFPGLTIGPRYNYPQTFSQDNWQARYDLSWRRDKHDFKTGGEFLRVLDTGQWFILERGQYRFHTRPPDLERRFPADAWNNPSRWDLTGLDPYVQFFDQNFHKSDWLIDIPRPQIAVWFGDNWRATDRLTINWGVRYENDFKATSPPHVTEKQIIVNNGIETIDASFYNGIRDNNNLAPRVGFVYNIGGNNDFVIRGGTGQFYSTPVSNVPFSQQVYNDNQMIAASFVYDGTPGFVLDPRRGYSPQDFLAGRAPLPPQSPRTIDKNYVMPYTWQSALGFQKQLGSAMSVESDLTHYVWRNDTVTRSMNLLYDPVTGYNVNPLTRRPLPEYNEIIYFQSLGRRDNLALSSALNRRFKDNFQAGVTYTYTFFYRDDTGSISWTEGAANNQFCHLDCEWATSTSFQRHTLRAHWMYQLPLGLGISGLYKFGSGNPINTQIATTPYGKPGTNRLNLGAPIRVPEFLGDRWSGPTVIGTGDVVPRNALMGLPLHTVDLRVTKDFTLAPSTKLSLFAEAFNVFNRNNWSGFTSQVDSASFGQPTSGSYRSGQLGLKLAF
jgi:hypothetical protein